MPMIKISLDRVKKIAEQYDLKPTQIKGTGVINIRKKSTQSDRFDDISWEEFESALKEKGLAVYKTAESDFLKIMKDK